VTSVVGIGDVLAGKYKVEWLLGQGGMGYVVAARHKQLDRQVAIKILMPELCEIEDAVARFLREARAAACIQNEHVARVLDVGTLEDNAPYMVMELLEGRDLAHELNEGVLPVTDAVDHVLQACEALAEAHALGIVHRDLKPANLFRTRRADGSPLIKVLDFGISKALRTVGDGAPLVHTTETQVLVGSPHYMSPEQVRSPKSVDARSDIWSLGITLYELLTGLPPFVSDSFMCILTAVVADEPADIRLLREDVPIGLQGVILKCLDKKASGRYANVVELAEALQIYAPAGAAAVARIASIAREAEKRRGTSRQPARVASGATTHGSEGGRSNDMATPTLQSPGRIIEVLDASQRAGEGWGHFQRRPERSVRWMALLMGGLLGAVLLALGAVLLANQAQPARSPTTATDVSSAPAAVLSTGASGVSSAKSEGSDPRLDRDAAIAVAADYGSPPRTKQAVVVAGPSPGAAPKKYAPARVTPEKVTTGGNVAPMTSSLPGLPAVDTPLDPLEGRH